MGSAQQSINVLSNQLVYREAAAEREPLSSISTPPPPPPTSLPPLFLLKGNIASCKESYVAKRNLKRC